jgi:hypothetical protein
MQVWHVSAQSQWSQSALGQGDRAAQQPVQQCEPQQRRQRQDRSLLRGGRLCQHPDEAQRVRAVPVQAELTAEQRWHDDVGIAADHEQQVANAESPGHAPSRGCAVIARRPRAP